MAVDALRSDGKPEGDALLAEYVQRYRRPIERLCRILLADSGDAEDAAQQTFLLAYQSLLAGTRPHHPRAWLCTIARRECWARDHRRRRERAVSHADARAEPDPAERTVVRAELATINAGLQALPARQRQAIVLRELAGLSYAQLAATLEISESAAEALLVRARRNLRDARLGLVLLLPFPRSFRRLVRLGSGHARAAVGVQAAKAVAVVTLVTATTAVAGSTVPVKRTADPSMNTAERSVRPAAVHKAPHRSVPKSAPVIHRVRRTRVEPAPERLVVAPARVHLAAPARPPSPPEPHAASTPAAAAPVEPAPRAATPAPKARTPEPSPPKAHPSAPKHAEPPPPPAKPPVTTPAPTATTPTGTDQPPATPPPPNDPTETSSPPSGDSPGPGTDDQGGQGNNGNPDDPGNGDGQPGNGNGDHNHDHDGDHGHHGPH